MREDTDPAWEAVAKSEQQPSSEHLGRYRRVRERATWQSVLEVFTVSARQPQVRRHVGTELAPRQGAELLRGPASPSRRLPQSSRKHRRGI